MARKPALSDIPPDAAGPEHATRGQKQIVGLDVLRFAAAMLVLFFHLGCTQWVDPSSEIHAIVGHPISFPQMLPIAAVGWVGVPVFFVISGFVIVLTAANATAHRFLVNRALRLLPCAWVCATVSFVIALWFVPDGGSELLGRYVRTLLFFPVPRWIDGAYWTLGVEINFYAIVYLLLVINRFERLEATITTLGVGSALIWCLSATPLWPGLDVLANKRVAQLALVTHGCDFALGVLIWAAASSGWTRRRLCAAGVCLVGAVLQIDYIKRFTLDDLALKGLSPPVVHPALMFLGFLALFLLAVRYNDVLTRCLGRGVAAVRSMGLSTYPLYLLHSFVGALAMRASNALGLPPSACLAAGIAVALIAALLVSELAEPRVRFWLRQFVERLGSRPPAVVRSRS